MTTLKVDVIQADIAEGRQQDCWRCPVAIATKRAIEAVGKGDRPVEVGNFNVMIGDQIVRLPHQVVLWIKRFDHNREGIGPVSFELILPNKP